MVNALLLVDDCDWTIAWYSFTKMTSAKNQYAPEVIKYNGISWKILSVCDVHVIEWYFNEEKLQRDK